MPSPTKPSPGSEATHEVPNLLSIQPQEVFENATAQGKNIIVEWNRDDVCTILAAMATEPRFVANVLRIDLLYRIVLANSNGDRTPDSTQLMQILNGEFRRARILNLEDPPESPPIEVVPTSRGNYRIMSGNIENAAARTQTLLSAFESMPTTQARSTCLDSAHALLTLSEQVIRRSNCRHSNKQHSFPPFSPITIDEITDHAQNKYTVFTKNELDALDIDPGSLTPFLMTIQQQSAVGHQRLMNSFLETKPILRRKDSSYILLPLYVSTAIATILMECELQNNTQVKFLSRMLRAQERYTYPSQFWDLSASKWYSINNPPLRHTTRQIETGRFIQVIQLALPIDNFALHGFRPQELPREYQLRVEQLIAEFWDFLIAKRDSTEGITILFISDWGAKFKLTHPLKDANAPPSWRYLPLHFAEIEALGIDDHGTLDDLCRIIRQVEILSEHGIHIMNQSGVLNLYEHWRRTKGRLMVTDDSTLYVDSSNSPSVIAIPTDLVRDVRERTIAKRDRKALPFVDGSYKVVQQFDIHDSALLEPIYIADDDLRSRTLRGAVSLQQRTWWVHVDYAADESAALSYNILRSVLHFMAEFGDHVIEEFPNSFQDKVRLVQIQLRASIRSAGGVHRPPHMDASPVPPERIQLHMSPDSIRVVRLNDAWLMSIAGAENIAELELAAATIEAISENMPSDDSRQRFRETIKQKIRSPDWRWIHTESVSTPIDKLRMNGLIKPFRPIRSSAFKVVTCGLLWEATQPSPSSIVVGKSECVNILTHYLKMIHQQLANLIGGLDLEAASILCGDHYQRAHEELQQWYRTYRALRAIGGADIGDVILRKRGESTTVKVTTKILCEIVTHEAPVSGGQSARWSVIEEILALLAVARASHQLLSSIQRGLIPAEVRVTPWGELVSDEEITQRVLRKSAQRSTNSVLEKAAGVYLEEHSAESAPNPVGEFTWDSEFEQALLAEYGISRDVVAQLADVFTDLAIERMSPVFLIDKSELSGEISSRVGYSSSLIDKFIDRLILSRDQRHFADQSLNDLARNLGRLDRPDSMISRPIPILNDTSNPRLLVIPICILDSLNYILYGLRSGSLQGDFWVSIDAKSYTGRVAFSRGRDFENVVGERLRQLGYEVQSSVKISGLLNRKVDNQLGDVDVLVVNREANRIWVIEAKDLKMVRTITEAAQRMHDYRGRMKAKGGGEIPDSLFRHLRRVWFLRDNSSSLMACLQFERNPEVRGLMVVSRDQPMSLLPDLAPDDGIAIVIDELDSFKF